LDNCKKDEENLISAEFGIYCRNRKRGGEILKKENKMNANHEGEGVYEG
jgi:hypothetical protein